MCTVSKSLCVGAGAGTEYIYTHKVQNNLYHLVDLFSVFVVLIDKYETLTGCLFLMSYYVANIQFN